MTVAQFILEGHAMTVEQFVYYMGAHHNCGTICFTGACHDWNTLFYRGTPWPWNSLYRGTPWLWNTVYFTGVHHDCGTVHLFYRGMLWLWNNLFILQGHAMTVEQCLFYRGMPWLWSNVYFTGACDDCGTIPKVKAMPSSRQLIPMKARLPWPAQPLCFEIFQWAPDEGADLTLPQLVTLSADDHLSGKCSYCKTQVELPGAPVCTYVCRWFWEKSFSVMVLLSEYSILF